MLVGHSASCPVAVEAAAPQYWRSGSVTMVRGIDAMRWYCTDQALTRLDPVVVVRGARDRIVRKDWSRSLTAIARGRLQTVGGAAHKGPRTHPDAVVVAVREVALSGVSGRPGGGLAIGVAGSAATVPHVALGFICSRRDPPWLKAVTTAGRR